MNPKLNFYVLISSFAMMISVVSAIPANASQANSQQTIEQRVNNIREILEQQDLQPDLEQTMPEDDNLISSKPKPYWFNAVWNKQVWWNIENWRNASKNWDNTGWSNWHNWRKI
jgi:rSAM-associated Gly-rich repeat protein